MKVSKNTMQDAQDEKHGVIEEKGGKESVGEGQMKEKCEKSDKKDENIQKTDDEGQLTVSKKDTKQRKDEKKGRKWGRSLKQRPRRPKNLSPRLIRISMIRVGWNNGLLRWTLTR